MKTASAIVMVVGVTMFNLVATDAHEQNLNRRSMYELIVDSAASSNDVSQNEFHAKHVKTVASTDYFGTPGFDKPRPF
jgi:hypothetical protein